MQESIKMRIFVKFFNLDYIDQLYYLINNTVIGDIYNDGEKRYMRVKKDCNHGRKWREL